MKKNKENKLLKKQNKRMSRQERNKYLKILLILLTISIVLNAGLYIYFKSKLEPIDIEKRQKIKVEKIYVQ